MSLDNPYNPPIRAVHMDTRATAIYAGPPQAYAAGPPPMAGPIAAAREAHMTNLLDEAKTVVANAASERANGASEEKGGPMQQIMDLLKELKMEKLMDQIIGLIEKMESGKPGERSDSGIITAGPGMGGSPDSGSKIVRAPYTGPGIGGGPPSAGPGIDPYRGPNEDTKIVQLGPNNSEAKFVGEPVTDASMNFQVAGPPPGPQGMMAKLEMLLNQLTSLMGPDKADGPADSGFAEYKDSGFIGMGQAAAAGINNTADSGFTEPKDSGFIGMGQAAAAGINNTADSGFTEPKDSGFIGMGQAVAAGIDNTAPSKEILLSDHVQEHIQEVMAELAPQDDGVFGEKMMEALRNAVADMPPMAKAEFELSDKMKDEIRELVADTAPKKGFVIGEKMMEAIKGAIADLEAKNEGVEGGNPFDRMQEAAAKVVAGADENRGIAIGDKMMEAINNARAEVVVESDDVDYDQLLESLQKLVDDLAPKEEMSGSEIEERIKAIMQDTPWATESKSDDQESI